DMRHASADTDELMAVWRKERGHSGRRSRDRLTESIWAAGRSPVRGSALRPRRPHRRPEDACDPEQCQTAEDEQHGVRGPDYAVADIADGITGKEQHWRPNDRGGDIGKPEPLARHAHHPGGERDDRAHRAEEAADKDALAAVPGKKPDAVRQQLRTAGEWPDTGNPAAEAVTDPERNGVAENRTDHRPRDDREIRQRARCHQGPGGDQERGAGKQQADKGERFAERGHEHDRDGPARMRRDEIERRLNEVFHIPFIASWLPAHQSPGSGDLGAMMAWRSYAGLNA